MTVQTTHTLPELKHTCAANAGSMCTTLALSAPGERIAIAVGRPKHSAPRPHTACQGGAVPPR